MLHQTQRLKSRLLTLMAVPLFGFSPPTQANLGIDWLTAQAQPDGHYSTRTANDIATPFTATAETLRTFYQLGETATSQPSVPAALDFLNAQDFPSTEHLSRTLITNQAANSNQSVTDLSNAIRSRLNDNGGFGDLAGYHHTVLDTAWALEALAMTQVIDTSISKIYPTIDFLLKQQRTEGGWADNDNDTSVATTAIVMHALWHYRHRLSNIPTLDVVPALDKAQQYLLTQRDRNGLWNNTIESALALIAILPRLTNLDDLSSTRDALRNAQSDNGSWDNDVYTTALTLRALAMAESPEPNPDLGQITGIVIDGQTGSALSGISVQLNGTATNRQITNAAGEFNFTGLLAGHYTVQIGTEGNTHLTAETLIKRSQQLNLGGLRLFPEGTTRLQGTITDATTGEPLTGATLNITGITDAIITDDQGTYLINNPTPGEALIQAQHQGYLTASNTITITAGTSLVVPLTLSPDQITLQGTITDGQTGLGLAGANIFINGTPIAQTEADGSYLLTDLPSRGEHGMQIRLELDHYEPVESHLTVPTGTTLVFSPQLHPTGTQPTPTDNARLIGLVRDKTTYLPLAGVRVTNGTETLTTDESGQFDFTNLAAGSTTLQWQRTGYVDKSLTLTLSTYTHLDLGPIMLTPEGDQITIGVKGLIMDASTNQTLANVNIETQIGETTTPSLTSQADGTFDIIHSAEPKDNLLAQLSFTIEGYAPYTLDLLLNAEEILDLGQVRLRPEEMTALLPDLLVDIDNTAVQTDPQTLAVSGTITANINNAGTAPTSGNTTLLAFYDVNLNSVYDTETDKVLGEALLEKALALEESATVDITLDGKLPFRDAPIHVWVDNAQAVVESDEQNNVEATSGQCRIVPPPLSQQPLQLKWHWDKGDVLGPPAVGQLSDDNKDGKIDNNDIPDLVFSAFPSGNKGTLYIVSGDDGQEHWSGGDVIKYGSAALGDIDGDGIVEIVIPLSGPYSYDSNELGAFEHDGTPIWKVAIGENSIASGVAIADLEHDGLPEIIYGRHVFEHDGSPRWTGTGDKATTSLNSIYRYGYNSLAADVDLDGIMEVVAGRTLYDGLTGDIKWHQSQAVWDGYNAVGNFDDDEFAEIVLVAKGKVYLLEHNGEMKWGPVSLPGGGNGGPPTVADVDNDGQPEIGVAGKYYYTVFETDGSVKWSSSRTYDSSSHATGSSVFDFESDGKTEVLYADEKNFYIYAGDTGDTLLSIPNGSGTTLEYPIVVDLDNDHHAEIVVTSSRYGSVKKYRGVRVFEAENDNWPATRAIWNQHTYHITNINDDGTIPQFEQPSWLTHNTYRLNTFADVNRDPLATPDLTASLLQVIDNGVGQPITLPVRIGNAGAIASSAGLSVTFYAGEANLGGTKLGTVTLDALAPGTYQDIQLEGVELIDFNQDIHAVVDAENQLTECNETNNRVFTSISTGTTNVLGDLNVTTEAPEYGPNTPVAIDYTLTNQGTLPADFQVELSIENADGETVEILDTPTLETLAGGETLTLDANWNTGTYLASGYQVHVRLVDRHGELVTEASHPFAITADEEALLTLQTTVDKPIYHTTDTVQINNLIRNPTINTLVTEAVVQITVFDEANQPVFSQPIALDDLDPNAQRESQLLYRFQPAAEGLYTVQSELVAHNGDMLASHTTQYQVQENLKLSLIGQVQVQQARLYQGEPQICTDTLTNDGTLFLRAQTIRQMVIALGSGHEEQVTELTLELEAEASQTLERTFTTAELEVGDHACVLQALIDDQWETLDYAVFQVDKPPIQIDLRLTSGQQGRLLVLLDDNHPKDNEPHGPKTAPTLTAQRAFLEPLLEANGWNYTIVTDKQAFTRELRTGGYLVYALFSEQQKLSSQVQKELREAVYRGEGLVVAGAHDQRHYLDNALGIKHQGQISNAAGLLMPNDTVPSETLTIPFAFVEPVQRAKLNGALTLGTFQLGANKYCQSDDDDSRSPRKNNDDRDEEDDKSKSDKDDKSDEDDKSNEDDESDEDEDDKSHDQCEQHELAMTFHQYGEGQSIYIGFDLLAQATATGQDSLVADVLLTALNSVHPDPVTHTIGRVIPLRMQLTNQGHATPGQALIYLPDGTHLIAFDEIEIDELDWTIVWPFELDLDQEAELEVWLRLPWVPSLMPVNARIQTGTAPDFDDYDRVNFEIDVVMSPCLPEALERLTALKDEQKYYAQALKYVQKAATYVQQQRDDKALKELLKAADQLLKSNHPEAHSLRVMVGNAIRNVAWLIEL